LTDFFLKSKRKILESSKIGCFIFFSILIFG
jgi:hypothetical protein